MGFIGKRSRNIFGKGDEDGSFTPVWIFTEVFKQGSNIRKAGVPLDDLGVVL